jgi:hypothetical protein
MVVMISKVDLMVRLFYMLDGGYSPYLRLNRIFLEREGEWFLQVNWKMTLSSPEKKSIASLSRDLHFKYDAPVQDIYQCRS